VIEDYFISHKMDFKPFVVIKKQPGAKSLTYEVAKDHKSITVHDKDEIKPLGATSENPVPTSFQKSQTIRGDGMSDIKRGLGSWNSFACDRVYQIDGKTTKHVRI